MYLNAACPSDWCSITLHHPFMVQQAFNRHPSLGVYLLGRDKKQAEVNSCRFP